MHPAAAKALFKRDTAALTTALAIRRGWVFHSLDYPVVDCSFHMEGRTPLRVRLACDNWNDSPPAVSLHAADGTLLGTPLSNPTGIFHPNVHPSTNQLFVCMKGTREYHTHPSHVTDLWELLRTHPSFDVGGILTQIWNGWCKGDG